MGITKTSMALFLVVILTVSFSNHNVSAVTGMCVNFFSFLFSEPWYGLLSISLITSREKSQFKNFVYMCTCAVIEEATPPPCLFLCNGFPLNDFACHHDCGSKGYNHGRCGGNPSRCCCSN